jgi:hypothetical protein
LLPTASASPPVVSADKQESIIVFSNRTRAAREMQALAPFLSRFPTELNIMATKHEPDTVIGVFHTRTQADHAMAELFRDEFTVDQVGLVIRNADGTTKHTDGTGETHAGEGAAIGAAAGAGIGGLVGLGVLVGVIPVIGPVLAIGTLGTILLNAAGGAAIAGVSGALVGWGIPEEDAKYYEGEVVAGRLLVTVHAPGRSSEARAILHRFEGYDRKSAPNATKKSLKV